MKHLSIDIETYSETDLGNCGLYKYVEDESFEILLFAYSYDFGEVQIVDLANGESLPIDLQYALFNPDVVKHAYNAAFEIACLSKFFNLTREQTVEWYKHWQCTLIHGYYCSFPGGLAKIGEAVGLPEDKKKMSVGKALIRYFCMPCKPTKANGGRTRNYPDSDRAKWDLFREYCKQDVVTESNVYMKICGISPPEWVWEQWRTDLEINSRGVAVDMALVDGALVINDELTREYMAELSELTGLQNPNSNVQFLAWLNGYINVENVQKQTVVDLLKRDDLPDVVRRALELRQETGKTSVKKFQKMIDTACADNRIRGLTQFYGASRTGRWAGRLVQIQNLARTYLNDIDTPRDIVKTGNTALLKMLYPKPTDVLSQLIRSAFVPDENCKLVDADLSAIEARVVAWLAGEEWVLEVFRGDGKIYEATAAMMFGIPQERIKKGNPEYKYRQLGKIGQLGCSYGGSVNAITAFDFNSEIPDEDKPGLVKKWRDANPKIVALWYEVENACMETIKTGRTAEIANGKVRSELVAFEGITYLRLVIPSGRALYYVNPHITINRFGNPSIGFKGQNQVTGKWENIETYGAKQVENMTQAIARDIIADIIMRVEAEGIPIHFSVHDEIACSYGGDAEKCLDRIIEIMSTPPEWANGLPLNAAGYTSDYFKKD